MSFFRRMTKPAANNSSMMKKRRIRMIGLTVFASFPFVSSSFLFSISVCSFSSSFFPSWFLLSSFSGSRDGIRKLVRDRSTHLNRNIYFAPVQAGTTCGASSQADLTQNLVLKTRMLRFSRHSRQKCRKRSFFKHQVSLTCQ